MTRYTYEGPRWFRSRIRSRGPFLALGPPALLGLLSLLLLNLTDGASSGLGALVLGVLAAPALLAVGAPFSSQSWYPAGIAISALLWLVLGFVAARRATRNPMATWADYWRDYGWLAGGVWLGAVTALAVARVVLGEALI